MLPHSIITHLRRQNNFQMRPEIGPTALSLSLMLVCSVQFKWPLVPGGGLIQALGGFVYLNLRNDPVASLVIAPASRRLTQNHGRYIYPNQ
jgi:hypothetical protein